MNKDDLSKEAYTYFKSVGIDDATIASMDYETLVVLGGNPAEAEALAEEAELNTRIDRNQTGARIKKAFSGATVARIDLTPEEADEAEARVAAFKNAQYEIATLNGFFIYLHGLPSQECARQLQVGSIEKAASALVADKRVTVKKLRSCTLSGEDVRTVRQLLASNLGCTKLLEAIKKNYNEPRAVVKELVVTPEQLEYFKSNDQRDAAINSYTKDYGLLLADLTSINENLPGAILYSNAVINTAGSLSDAIDDLL